MSPRLRRFCHVAVAEALYYSGALAAWRWFRRTLVGTDEVCVLGLHRVLTPAEQEQSSSLDGMVIRENTYLALLAYLQKHFDVVSLGAFLGETNGAKDSSGPRCLITFDDGWVDTYSRAFPGLRKYRLPAVVFLATGTIGSRGGFWVEHVKRAWRNPEARGAIQAAMRDGDGASNSALPDLEGAVEWLKRMPTLQRNEILSSALTANASACARTAADERIDAMLTWDQARDMSAAGIELGAHTVNHPLLSYEDAASVEMELKASKQAIEERLGKRVRAFAYPNGDWNERVREQVAAAGFECAFTTHSAWHDSKEDSLSVSRVLLHEGNITSQTGEFSPAMLNMTLAGWA